MSKKIAVVDDELPFLELMRIVLEDAGYEVLACDEADQAVAMVHENLPDLVLLDLHMPGRSGWEILDALRADPAARDIPIIFTTAADEEIRAANKSLARERVSCLLKPFDIDDLLAKVAGTVT